MTQPTLPATYPLPIATPEQALATQQQLVAALMRHFPDGGLFQADVGVVPDLGRPQSTARVERALADAFGVPAAALVQGAGTGAIRAALGAGPWRSGSRRLLVHEAPDYPTTAALFADAGADLVRADANNRDAWEDALADPDGPDWVFLQHTRQRLGDSYDLGTTIEAARRHGKRVIVDDNYAIIRTPHLGAQMGAAASAFSLFKLHGPEGVAAVVGDSDIVDAVQQANYSGGGQVQGHQALDAIRALVMVPLNWAAQSAASMQIVARLQAGELPGVADAALANAQDLCVIVLLEEPIAERVRTAAATLGAAPYPVGSNSRYEIAPLVYRLSSSSLDSNPELAAWALRINPMRAGADVVIDLLQRALNAAQS
ncbi:MAG: aminotransferase class V-fold PLP-dependent enzyme [Propioniciclava sp.]